MKRQKKSLALVLATGLLLSPLAPSLASEDNSDGSSLIDSMSLEDYKKMRKDVVNSLDNLSSNYKKEAGKKIDKLTTKEEVNKVMEDAFGDNAKAAILKDPSTKKLIKWYEDYNKISASLDKLETSKKGLLELEKYAPKIVKKNQKKFDEIAKNLDDRIEITKKAQKKLHDSLKDL